MNNAQTFSLSHLSWALAIALAIHVAAASAQTATTTPTATPTTATGAQSLAELEQQLTADLAAVQQEEQLVMQDLQQVTAE
jgi:hypothetical protein